MRFLIAIGLFVVALILAVVGFAQRTIWAPPAQYSMTIQSTSSAPYLVVPSSVIDLHPGNPTVIAKSGGPVFVASGRESDIAAFVDQSSVAKVSGDLKSGLSVSTRTGALAPADPNGSDLWRAQVKSVSNAALAIDVEQGGAALVASTGLTAAPANIQLVWKGLFDPTISNILLWLAAILMLVASILTFIEYRQMRINRGPRRRTPKAPRPPRYRYRSILGKPVRGRRAARFTALVSGGLILALVTGCAPSKPSSEVSASPTASTQVQPVSLLPAQTTRILDDVAGVATDADTSLNKDALAERFAGPALQVRLTNYQLRKLNSRIAAVQSVVSHPLQFSLPAATSVWPRTFMAVTDEKGDSNLPQMLVLQQDSPRTNYKLWFAVRLMPGAKIPAMPPTDIGAIMVDPASLFLKVAPNKLPAVFGDVLNSGQSSVSAPLFNLDNQFYKQVSGSQQSQILQLKKANIQFGHTLGDANVISLATSNGGALVAVYQTDVATIKPTKAGSAVSVGAEEKLLLGSNGSTRGVRSIYGDMLLFYVPAIDDQNQITLIGATQGLISVSSL